MSGNASQKTAQSLPRRRRSFAQRDVTRAVKAVAAAGATVTRVDVRPDGTISIVTGNLEAIIPSDSSNNWDVL